MRIGIDARFYGSLGKGLGRYTQKLIENLEKISAEERSDFDKTNRYFIFLRRENWDEYVPKRKNFFKVLADIPWYSLREQLFLSRIFKNHNLDLVHFPHFNVPLSFKGKFVVTIHDLILFHFPTKKATTLSPLLYFIKKAGYKRVIRNAISKSEAIITVSEHTKKDILKYFSVNPKKITITYESVDIHESVASEPSDMILKKYGIIKPYVLYVGNAYPHKNLENMLFAFREVLKRHPCLNLVMVGKLDYFYRRLKKIIDEQKIKNVILTDFVADSHLSSVYREAILYVFPSLYEGFGLPPLEAMSKNVPVISSNSSCLPEILGEAAFYFDPRGITEIAETINTALTDSQLRQKLIRAGKLQIKKYSWEKLAWDTERLYKSIHSQETKI